MPNQPASVRAKLRNAMKMMNSALGKRGTSRATETYGKGEHRKKKKKREGENKSDAKIRNEGARAGGSAAFEILQPA